jgi:hypothetical protein
MTDWMLNASLPRTFDVRVDWDYIMWSHISPPLLVKSLPGSLYGSNSSSLPHVQDQRDGVLPWLPLRWRENDLVILNIRVKHVLTLVQ